MLRIIASFKSTVRSLGWVDGLTYLLAQGLWQISGGWLRVLSYVLVVQPIGEGIGIPAHRGRDIDIQEVDPQSPLLALMHHPEEVINARFSQGARCLVALKHGDLVGFLWWVAGPYQEDEVRCLFIPEPQGITVWDFDVYICRQQRCTPVFSRLWDTASKLWFAEGYRYSASRISAFNPASLAAHQRLGAKIVGHRLFICVGRLELSFSRQSPRCVITVKGSPRVRVGF